MKPSLFVGLCLLFFSCSPGESPVTGTEKSKAQEIVDKAIEAHGGDAFSKAAVEFDFRGRHYSWVRFPDRYIYTRSFSDSTGQVIDTLVNSSMFSRTLNGKTESLNEEWKSRYANSVNSVLYFVQLPYGLNDPAVNKKYLGETSINGQPYQKIEVTFDQQGGGKDFEDIFVYWFHRDSHLLDYFGYYYNTDETGIRFREAINRRQVGGMLLQDYINYEPIDSTATVYQLDSLFEAGGLKELSRIVNENFQLLNP